MHKYTPPSLSLCPLARPNLMLISSGPHPRGSEESGRVTDQVRRGGRESGQAGKLLHHFNENMAVSTPSQEDGARRVERVRAADGACGVAGQQGGPSRRET